MSKIASQNAKNAPQFLKKALCLWWGNILVYAQAYLLQSEVKLIIQMLEEESADTSKRV